MHTHITHVCLHTHTYRSHIYTPMHLHISTYIQTHTYTHMHAHILSFEVLGYISVCRWIWHEIPLRTKCLAVFPHLFHRSVTRLLSPPLPPQVTQWWDSLSCSQLLPTREQKNWNLRSLWMIELYPVGWKFKNIDLYPTGRTCPQSELICNRTGWTRESGPHLPVIGGVQADSGKLLAINAIAEIPARWAGLCTGN